MKGERLEQLIKAVIDSATAIDLRVVAVTFDMGPSNQAMWKAFGVHSKRDLLITSVPNPCNIQLVVVVIISAVTIIFLLFALCKSVVLLIIPIPAMQAFVIMVCTMSTIFLLFALCYYKLCY
jgi:hypothetical protein